MSNKPKIYSFCDAGCKWPTVHEDDFLKAATFIEKPVDLIREGRNIHYLEIGKQYKIKAAKSDEGFNCGITFEFTESNVNTSRDTFGIITIPNTDKYADSFVFKLLEVVHDTDNILYLIYERSGVRIKQGISGVSSDPTKQFSFKENNLYVDGADAVYEYNSEANYSISYSFDENVKLVESERQKSKNLLGSNRYKKLTKNGVDFVVNEDGSITAKGTASYNAIFSMDTIILPAGTYFASLRKPDGSTDILTHLQLHYDNIWINVENKSFTLDSEKSCGFEFYVATGVSVDETIYIQLEKGTQATDYQAYNGAIAHKEDIQRHIITGSLIAGFDVPDYDAFHKVPFVEYKKIGYKLTMDGNGGVVIGAGVKNILVNISANSYVSEIGYQSLRLYKNNTIIAYKYEQTKDTAGRAIGLDMTPILLDVTEGDVITLRFKTTSLASLLSDINNGIQTYMTVEVVE